MKEQKILQLHESCLQSDAGEQFVLMDKNFLATSVYARNLRLLFQNLGFTMKLLADLQLGSRFYLNPEFQFAEDVKNKSISFVNSYTPAVELFQRYPQLLDAQLHQSDIVQWNLNRKINFNVIRSIMLNRIFGNESYFLSAELTKSADDSNPNLAKIVRWITIHFAAISAAQTIENLLVLEFSGLEAENFLMRNTSLAKHEVSQFKAFVDQIGLKRALHLFYRGKARRLFTDGFLPAELISGNIDFPLLDSDMDLVGFDSKFLSEMKNSLIAFGLHCDFFKYLQNYKFTAFHAAVIFGVESQMLNLVEEIGTLDAGV